MNNTELKEKIEQMEKELAELKKAVKENDEPKFERVAEDEPYYYIYLRNIFTIGKSTEQCTSYDNKVFELNNYFRSRERAEEVAKKIKMLLKLERLHDIYCPDYVPDFTDTSEIKYYVFRSTKGIWLTSFYDASQDAVNVYFSTQEIAKKVCNILNAEKGE